MKMLDTLSPATVSSTQEENARLEEVALWYDSRRGLNYELIKHAARCITARARGHRALELGCASGVMTEELAARFPQLDVVEAAASYAQRARALLPEAGRVYQCLFEEFRPRHDYDVVVMTWVLEHVLDPRGLLARARGWMAPGSEIFIVVPNAESLHRRVGLHMGLLAGLNELNDSDLAIGHRRVYTWDTLSEDIAAAGLDLVTMEGIMLKPLSSAQMEAWPSDLPAAFFALAPLAPRLCSEIFAVCRNPD